MLASPSFLRFTQVPLGYFCPSPTFLPPPPPLLHTTCTNVGVVAVAPWEAARRALGFLTLSKPLSHPFPALRTSPPPPVETNAQHTRSFSPSTTTLRVSSFSTVPLLPLSSLSVSMLLNRGLKYTKADRLPHHKKTCSVTQSCRRTSVMCRMQVEPETPSCSHPSIFDFLSLSLLSHFPLPLPHAHSLSHSLPLSHSPIHPLTPETIDTQGAQA